MPPKQGAMDDLANGISLPQHRGFPSPRPRFDSLEPSQRVGQHPVFRDTCHTPNRVPVQTAKPVGGRFAPRYMHTHVHVTCIEAAGRDALSAPLHYGSLWGRLGILFCNSCIHSSICAYDDLIEGTIRQVMSERICIHHTYVQFENQPFEHPHANHHRTTDDS